MTTNTAQKCLDDLIDKMQGISEFQNKTFTLYQLEELESKSANLTYPSAGVIYESMMPVDGKANGLQVEISCLIVVFVMGPGWGVGVEQKARAVDLLDNIRSVLRDTRSPSQYHWQFKGEAPFLVPKKGVLAFAQRWSTRGIV